MQDNEIVWLTEQRHYAELISRGAYFSTVVYTREGHEVTIDVENDEYEFWEDRAIGYECD